MSHPVLTRDELLTFAYEELLWISEYPNRTGEEHSPAVGLAERAREAIYRIEANDAPQP